MSKTSLKQHIKNNILHSYPPRAILSQEDFDFMCDLLKNHPRFEEKQGVGIDFISIEISPVNPKNKQFVLHRMDGTSTDFSYLKCVDKELSKERLFKAACRQAVEDQIKRFRSQFSPQENNGTHVDHHPVSFNRLVEQFINEFKIDVEHTQINGFADNEMKKRFADKQLEQDFSQFHFKHAQLRLISTQENLRKKRD